MRFWSLTKIERSIENERRGCARVLELLALAVRVLLAFASSAAAERR